MFGRHALTLALSLVPLAAIPACPAPHPVVPPNPDAQDAAPRPPGPLTPCEEACVTLASIGCPEGTWTNCPARLAQWEADRLIRSSSGHPLTCIDVAAATSIGSARAAGVTCPDGAP